MNAKQTPAGRGAARPDPKKRPGTNSQSRSASGTGSPASKKKKRKTNPLRRLTLTAMRCFLLFGVLLAITLFVKHRYVDVPTAEELSASIDTGKYYPGIRVNGTEIGDLSYDEARALLLPQVEKEMKSIGITVAHGSSIWILNAADMGVSTTLDEVLTKAMTLGRNGTLEQNTATQERLLTEGEDFEVRFKTDLTTLTAAITKINSAVGTLPVEPTAEPDPWAESPTFIYTEGKDGYIFNTGALISEINACLEEGDYQARLSPQLSTTPPEKTIADLEAKLQPRAIWQTSFGGSSSSRNANRVGNIQKAATILNGTMVADGEEWSFNAFFGPRTEKGGWPLAPGIVNGNTYQMEAGGGICQVSTTLYNALLCSGPEIEITERHHHSWPSSYADTGLDSTVTGTVTDGKSLNFVNNTGEPIYIFAYCDQENYTMTIYLYGMPLEEGVSYTTRGVVTETLEPGETKTAENPQWPSGYQENTITARKGYIAEAYRDKLVNGEVVESELLYTDKYRAVTGEVTIGTGDPSLPKPEKK